MERRLDVILDGMSQTLLKQYENCIKQKYSLAVVPRMPRNMLQTGIKTALASLKLDLLNRTGQMPNTFCSSFAHASAWAFPLCNDFIYKLLWVLKSRLKPQIDLRADILFAVKYLETTDLGSMPLVKTVCSTIIQALTPCV